MVGNAQQHFSGNFCRNAIVGVKADNSTDGEIERLGGALVDIFVAREHAKGSYIRSCIHCRLDGFAKGIPAISVFY